MCLQHPRKCRFRRLFLGDHELTILDGLLEPIGASEDKIGKATGIKACV